MSFVSAVKIRPKEGDVYFDVVAVVDPVTRDAQKLAPLLTVCPNATLRPYLPIKLRLMPSIDGARLLASL